MTVKIALLGFGTVASGVPLLLKEVADKMEQTTQQKLEISKVLVRDEAKKETLLAQGYPYTFVTDIDEIISDPEIGIVVELMGRIEPAKTYIEKALKVGKHVVTANKDLLALHGAELFELAGVNNLALYYEGAVAGGIPILRTLANSLVADKVNRVLGILNGTSNFMMTKMVAEGWSYEAALAKAQELGYAESDPTNDVDGIDAAYKAVILSQFAFGMTIGLDDVVHKGIRTITPSDVAVAEELGYVIKLVASIEETPSGLAAEVSPTFLPESHPLASVNGVMNAVYIESLGLGQALFSGPGAGQLPTATSVVADLIRITRRITDATVGKSFNEYRRETVLARDTDIISGYYLAIQTPDQPGQILRLAEIFNAEQISFKQLLQHDGDGQTARVVIVTHSVNKEQLLRVTKSLEDVPDFKIHNILRVLGE